MSESRRNERIGMLAVALTAILWGTSGTAAAMAPELSAVTVGAVAMCGGGLLQAAVNARGIRAAWSSVTAQWRVALLGGVCVLIYPLCFFGSMRVGGVALGTVVSLASAPLVSAVIERVADGRRLTLRWTIACALGIVGSAALAVSRSESSHADTLGGSSSSALGVGLGLLAGITYAGLSWAMRRLMNRSVPRGAATGTVMGLGGVFLLPVVAVGVPAVVAHPETLGVLAYLVLVPQFLGYVLFSRGLGRIDSSTATTITLIEPAVATALAVGVLSESITAIGWVGIAMLAAALVVLLAPRLPSATGPASTSVDAGSSTGRSTHEAVPRGRRGA
ncbi:DMT family transporter [uncultured Gordonia sp.]|uniref:DMT family transporter n=1 Tax=uncultured Gordonia sp. TaxID=198437 RepID=UPI0025975EC9|nr:EamA family transporter [uncultured Gordonia sp.]